MVLTTTSYEAVKELYHEFVEASDRMCFDEDAELHISHVFSYLESILDGDVPATEEECLGQLALIEDTLVDSTPQGTLAVYWSWGPVYTALANVEAVFEQVAGYLTLGYDTFASMLPVLEIDGVHTESSPSSPSRLFGADYFDVLIQEVYQRVEELDGRPCEGTVREYIVNEVNTLRTLLTYEVTSNIEGPQ